VKHPKVLKLDQLPAKLPTAATIAWFLLLDRFHAPGWLWGAVGVVAVIHWAGSIYAMCVQQPVRLKELTADAEAKP
jgi:hypothetical protein